MDRTDTKFSFILDKELCETDNPHIPGNCDFDRRVFVGTGSGRQASNNAFQKCIASHAQYVARFDCSGGQVDEHPQSRT